MPRPGSKIIKSFRLRVDAVDGVDDERVVAFLKEYGSGKYLLVHHTTTTENPHYHAYVETYMTGGNFSNKLKERLRVTGSDYSCPKCDEDRKLEYLSYLFNTKKGNVPRYVSSNEFTELDVMIHRENAKQIANEYEVRMKTNKPTMYDVAIQVLDKLREGNMWAQLDAVYDLTISTLKSNHMLARPFVVRDIISTVMSYSDCKQARREMKDKTLRFFQEK